MREPEFRPFRYRSDDGLTLYGRDYGCGARKPVPIVCLSGLSRNSRDFHHVALRLNGEGYRVITLDYRGRGESDRDKEPANYNVAREGQDVITALDHLGIRRAAFIGTSRGGLILHVLAVSHLERIAAVVLNDIGPFVEAVGLRRIRDYLSTHQDFGSVDDVTLALRSVHAKEFPTLTGEDWQDMATALYRNQNERWISDFDPALVEPLKTMDMSKPLPDLWPQFAHLAEKPLLTIRGENSTLLSENTVEEMKLRHGYLSSATAPGQGHAPLLHLDGAYRPLAAFLHAHA